MKVLNPYHTEARQCELAPSHLFLLNLFKRTAISAVCVVVRENIVSIAVLQFKDFKQVHFA